MAKRKMARNLTSKHQNTTEASDPVIDVLSRAGARVSAGVTSRSGIIRQHGLRIKMWEEKSCVRLTVLSKLGKQELHVFGLKPDLVRANLSKLSEKYSLKVEGQEVTTC